MKKTSLLLLGLFSFFVASFLILIVIFFVVFSMLLNQKDKSIFNAINTIKNIDNNYTLSYDNTSSKVLKIESDQKNHYIAFIELDYNSNSPILARCYKVKATGQIMFNKYFYFDQYSDFLSDFSPISCSTQAKQNKNFSDDCYLNNCHGLEIECGNSKRLECTLEYQIGDVCRQFAQCEKINGKCQQIESFEFDQCKSCVEDCIQLYKNDSQKMFDCEATCY